MDSKIKNYVGWAGVLALLVASFAMFSYVGTYSDMSKMGSPSFGASGEGKVLAKPDIAKFNFQVIDQGSKDIAALQKANSEKINKVIDFLKTEGVKADDISTAGYNIEPRYQYYGCADGGACPPSEIVGYTITQSVEVKVRDFSKISKIVSGVVAKGANSISQLSFAVDDETKLRAEARAMAIKKAEEQARGIAKAAGVKLGRLMYIEEITNQGAYGGYGMGGGADMKIAVPEMAASPNIEPGAKEVKVNVMLRYEMK